MTQDEQKEFINTISNKINKIVLDNYFNKLKTVYINYDIKEYIHRLFLCIMNLYNDAGYDIDIEKTLKDISYETKYINIDNLINIQMMCINKLMNDYIDKKYNICKRFNINKIDNKPYLGNQCYGLLYIYFISDGFGYHGSSKTEESFHLAIDYNYNNIMSDDVYNVLIDKKTYIDDFLTNNDFDNIKRIKEEVMLYKSELKNLMSDIKDFLENINKTYRLGINLQYELK